MRALLLLSCLASRTVLASDTISVNVASPLRTLPANFQGINLEAFCPACTADPAEASESTRAALAQIPIKTIRFPGGTPGDYYDWQCPYWNGTDCTQTPSSWSNIDTDLVWSFTDGLGGTLLLQATFKDDGMPNPPGQSYAYNSPANAAAWASYAKSHGMKYQMEIGNEEDTPANNSQTAIDQGKFDGYITGFQQFAAAIHAADASAQVFGPVGTNLYYWWALDSLGAFLQATGNEHGDASVDGVSLHFYDETGSYADAAKTPQDWEAADGAWAFISNRIASNDSRALPVYISEWHHGPITPEFNQSMGNALVTADMIGAFAHSGVAGHQYFDIHGIDGYMGGNAWGLIAGSFDSEPLNTPTPTYYAFVMWGRMGDLVLDRTQTDDATIGISSWATQRSSDGAVQVMLLNKGGADETANIGFAGFDATGKTVKVHTLIPSADQSSTSVTYNGVVNPQTASLPAPATQTASGAGFSVTVPKYAIMLLDFAGNGAVSTGGGTSGGTSGGGGAPGGSPGSGSTAGGTTGASQNKSTGKSMVGSCQSSGGDPLFSVVVLVVILGRRQRRSART